MTDSTMESVESFRLRARAWLAEHMPPRDEAPPPLVEDDAHEWERARELQQKLYAGGFAGICFPREYGGLGLTFAHQQAFTEESDPYEMPLMLNVPTFAICAATLLDMGDEEQKRDRIGAAVRGDEILCQFLSEPSGGSDLAGLITRADRDGDGWVLNGAKTWSTSAYAADWGLCLARTDWDVSKHRGLTMFLVPTKAPGVTMNRIRMINGNREFCEEFFDDVVLPASAVVGEVGGGWTVASRQLFHERNALGGGSPFVSGRGEPRTMPRVTPPNAVRASGRADDPRVREMLGEHLTLTKVAEQTADRVSRAIESGGLPPAAASIPRLLHAEAVQRGEDLALRITGSNAATGTGAGEGMGGRTAIGYLMRQSASLGGGSTEMSRNVISERMLGMPREPAPDRDVPFKQVKRGR
ncbi:acyl-CoA dehydrogenase family protein [Actinomadura algeriensis]|uniref:Alkylation response protein AidB-like acyl-CoA dehydrogenase n=1 Tax=Actinomadura algeriensis TaxID=1679523 RepID=A0ABR9K216_9ACTN|nr:acyl-CoA dehydrogenase family protein [Actinomadura algeriensis]MBE1536873.1 alkylation response protein AidB-like acyl-CoA dehydrogenase [Actinomadura algeriensis]